MNVIQEEEDDEFYSFDQWDPMREDYQSSKNTLTMDPDKDPESMVTGEMLPDGSKLGKVKICDHFARYGKCADGEYCDRAHIDPRHRERVWALQRTYEMNKGRTCITQEYLSPIDLDIKNPSQRLLVSITSMKSPSHFYFVAPYEQMNFANIVDEDIDFYIGRVPNSSSAKKKLDRIHEKLAALFDHDFRIDNINAPIYPGQIVACKTADERFHRALVLETDDPLDDIFEYKLLLLDVGVEVELNRETIYDIKAQCLSEPPMAVKCRLDIQPLDGALEWSKETLDYLNDYIRSEKFWLCKVVDFIAEDDIYTVDLYHIRSKVSLTKGLIARGLADCRQTT